MKRKRVCARSSNAITREGGRVHKHTSARVESDVEREKVCSNATTREVVCTSTQALERETHRKREGNSGKRLDRYRRRHTRRRKTNHTTERQDRARTSTTMNRKRRRRKKRTNKRKTTQKKTHKTQKCTCISIFFLSSFFPSFQSTKSYHHYYYCYYRYCCYYCYYCCC